MEGSRLAVYQFIARYIAQHGYPPTVREIGAACYLASTSAVAYHLGRLEADGVLVREPHTSRNIRLVQPWPAE